MDTVRISDAKTHLAELIQRVSRGERIAITRHGVPVAMLIPPEVVSRRPAAGVIAQLRQYRKGIKLHGLSIHRLIEEERW